MQKTKKIYIAGHTGMIGSAILRKLSAEGFDNLILRTSKELDLRNQKAVNEFFEKEKPEIVILKSSFFSILFEIYNLIIQLIDNTSSTKIIPFIKF